MVHPPRRHLSRLVDGTLEADLSAEVVAHVENCEFCREFCEYLRQFNQAIAEAAKQELPVAALAQADRLYQAALVSRVIPLQMLSSETAASRMALAADSENKESDSVRNLTTLYSENPEVVLRVMHDPRLKGDYLQLIADDPSLVANVLVQVPDKNWELLTDAGGRAEFTTGSLQDFEHLKWQIKLPEAVFELRSLPKPHPTGATAPTVLSNEHGDRIEVGLSAEESTVSVRVLEIGGRSEFDRITVSVSQERSHALKPAEPGKTVSFELDHPDATVFIRLFD